MYYILYSHCSCQESFFFCYYCLHHYRHHHYHFIFFNNTGHWGRIHQINSSGMVYPHPFIILSKP